MIYYLSELETESVPLQPAGGYSRVDGELQGYLGFNHVVTIFQNQKQSRYRFSLLVVIGELMESYRGYLGLTMLLLSFRTRSRVGTALVCWWMS